MIYDLLVNRSAEPDGWRVVTIRDLADVVGVGLPIRTCLRIGILRKYLG
jgi:hypothetical protein